jgi:hypothetical protein
VSQQHLNNPDIDTVLEQVGGSDANTLLSGDADRIVRLWQQKREEVPEDDLSDRIQVALEAVGSVDG